MNYIFEEGLVVFDYFKNYIYKMLMLNYYKKSNSED